MFKYNVSLHVKSNTGSRTVQVEVEHEKQWLPGGDKALRLEIIQKAATDNGIDSQNIDYEHSGTTINLGFGTFGLSMPERVEKKEDPSGGQKQNEQPKKKSKGSKLWRILKTIISFGMANGESISDAKNLVDKD